MPYCPYCGKWFRSNKALKQHIYKAHPLAPESAAKDFRKMLGLSSRRKSGRSRRKSGSSKSRRRR